jgi:hypothetical protein
LPVVTGDAGGIHGAYRAVDGAVCNARVMPELPTAVCPFSSTPLLSGVERVLDDTGFRQSSDNQFAKLSREDL